MGLRSAFWKFAHQRYQLREPKVAWEVLAFGWGGFFLVIYLIGFAIEPVHTLSKGVGFAIFLAIPLALGILHRRIRIEKAKGADALYRKRISCT